MIITITIRDISEQIRKGMIKEYIPPRKGGNHEVIKKIVVLQELFLDVFQEWISCGTATNKVVQIPMGTDGVSIGC